VSVYLYQRLLAHGGVDRASLTDALLLAQSRQVSLVEALVQRDVSIAGTIAACVAEDGEDADASWRPDSRLLLDLPPGICERYLAFPFRERAGSVEVATVTPYEDSIGLEFAEHLGRAIVLYRGSVQALLAAAGAEVDFRALSACLTQPPPEPGEAPIPLVRKSEGKEKSRERTPTSPGLGRSVAAPVQEPVIQRAPSVDPGAFPHIQMAPVSSRQPSMVPSIKPAGTARPPTWVSPAAGGETRVRESRDARELAQAVGAILPAPALVFELRNARLKLRSATGPGAYGDTTVSLVAESALSTAVEEGNYLGPWYDCAVHERFSNSFQRGALVRVERIGTPDRGLIVTMIGEFDASRAADILEIAGDAWSRILEREKLRGG